MKKRKRQPRPSLTAHKIKDSVIQSDSVVIMHTGVNGKVKVLDTPAKKRKHLA